MLKINKKSQAAITDLFIAIAIFIALVTVTTSAWNLYNTRLTSRIANNDMVVKAFQISDVLLKTPGYPNNWENLVGSNKDAIKYVGVVENEKIIPLAKLQGLQKLDIADLKKMFRIGQYEFGLRVKDSDGTILFQVGTFGIKSKYTVNLARTMLHSVSPSLPLKIVDVEIKLSKPD